MPLVSLLKTTITRLCDQWGCVIAAPNLQLCTRYTLHIVPLSLANSEVVDVLGDPMELLCIAELRGVVQLCERLL